MHLHIIDNECKFKKQQQYLLNQTKSNQNKLQQRESNLSYCRKSLIFLRIWRFHLPRFSKIHLSLQIYMSFSLEESMGSILY